MRALADNQKPGRAFRRTAACFVAALAENPARLAAIVLPPDWPVQVA